MKINILAHEMLEEILYFEWKYFEVVQKSMFSRVS